MVKNTSVMQSPDDLNDTDLGILELLQDGRETRGSLVDQLGRAENYVGERLRWLRANDLVGYHHEPTALYELTDKGEEWYQRATSA